jgi:hypothetical protein
MDDADSVTRQILDLPSPEVYKSNFTTKALWNTTIY